MKQKAFFIFLFLFFILLVSCGGNGSNPKNSFALKGNLQGDAKQSLWLEEMTPDGHIFVDSIPFDNNGDFTYHSKEIPYHTLYILHVGNFAITLLPSEGEVIHLDIKTDARSLTYDVKGSPESTLLWQLQNYSNDGLKILYSLVDTVARYDNLLASGAINQKTYDSKKDECDSIFRDAFVEQQEYAYHFIEEHKGSLTSLIALYKDFNRRPLIDPHDPNSIDYYDLVLEGLQQTLPDNPHTLHFKNTTEHLRSALARQDEIANKN